MDRWPWSMTCVLFLAGCLGGGPAGSSEPGPIEGEGADVSDAKAGSEDPAASEDPVVGHCGFQRTALNTPFGAGANVDAQFGGSSPGHCPFSVADGANWTAASALVEVVWGQLQATETEVYLRIDSTDCEVVLRPAMECNAGLVSGSVGPLRIAIEGTDYEGLHDAAPEAYVFASGLSVESPFDVYISLFPGPEVPDGYTAIPL